jgi:hypothetical protein
MQRGGGTRLAGPKRGPVVALAVLVVWLPEGTGRAQTRDGEEQDLLTLSSAERHGKHQPPPPSSLPSVSSGNPPVLNQRVAQHAR